MSDPQRHPEQRIAALEESVGFAEHKAGKLDSLVTDLSAQVYELATRLERLERKITDLQTDVQSGQGAAGEVPNDPPPHSHRPL